MIELSRSGGKQPSLCLGKEGGKWVGGWCFVGSCLTKRGKRERRRGRESFFGYIIPVEGKKKEGGGKGGSLEGSQADQGGSPAPYLYTLKKKKKEREEKERGRIEKRRITV